MKLTIKEILGQIFKKKFKKIFKTASIFFLLFFIACSTSKKKKKSPVLDEIPPDVTQDASNAPDPADQNDYLLEFKPPTKILLSTKTDDSDLEETCTENIEVKVLKDQKPVKGVKVSFRAIKKSVAEVGEALPAITDTDEEGLAVGKFCSGKKPGTVNLIVRAGKVIKDLGTITTSIRKKTSFNYVSFSYSQEATSSNVVYRGGDNKLDANNNTDKNIQLNLRSSGLDCGNLTFQAKLGGDPIVGQKVKFRSQTDYPPGANLGKRSEQPVTEVDVISGKPYLIYEGVSDTNGVFVVPLCSSYFPGQMIVQAVFNIITAEGKEETLRASSPNISMEGGQTNWGNMSFTFNRDNYKIVTGNFISNREVPLPFSLRAFSRYDGLLSNPFPFGVATEYAKVTVSNSGLMGADSKLDFSITPFDLFSYRPVRVTNPGISRGIAYSPMCDPEDFLPSANVSFSELAKDWRSTIMVYTQGGEMWFDANVNGSFDEADSLGFWDKNQNGILDCAPLNPSMCDSVTFVGPNRSQAEKNLLNRTFDSYQPDEVALANSGTIYSKDWFVDMASPFVDANENGTPMTDGKIEPGELALGGEFKPPNGRMDNLNFIWKNFFVGVYAGLTRFSISSRVISSDRVDKRFLITADGSDLDPNANPKKYLSAYFRSSYLSANQPFLEPLWNSSLSPASPFYPADGKVGVQNMVFGENSIAVIATNKIDGGAQFYRYFFGQGNCGIPFPGGTTLKRELKINETDGPIGRTVNFDLAGSPSDYFREIERKQLLFVDETTDKIGPAISDHPASLVGYPLLTYTTVTGCTNRCYGNTSTPGSFCPAVSALAQLTITTPMEVYKIPQSIFLPAVQTCVCTSGKPIALSSDSKFTCLD